MAIGSDGSRVLLRRRLSGCLGTRRVVLLAVDLDDDPNAMREEQQEVHSLNIEATRVAARSQLPQRHGIIVEIDLWQECGQLVTALWTEDFEIGLEQATLRLGRKRFAEPFTELTTRRGFSRVESFASSPPLNKLRPAEP